MSRGESSKGLLGCFGLRSTQLVHFATLCKVTQSEHFSHDISDSIPGKPYFCIMHSSVVFSSKRCKFLEWSQQGRLCWIQRHTQKKMIQLWVSARSQVCKASVNPQHTQKELSCGRFTRFLYFRTVFDRRQEKKQKGRKKYAPRSRGSSLFCYLLYPQPRTNRCNEWMFITLPLSRMQIPFHSKVHQRQRIYFPNETLIAAQRGYKAF